jgi:hypothetical protein
VPRRVNLLARKRVDPRVVHARRDIGGGCMQQVLRGKDERQTGQLVTSV